MNSLSEHLHSEGSTWKGILITASILSCWIKMAYAQGAPITVIPDPSHGTEGSSVTLTITGFSGKALSYTWYRKSVDNANKIAFYTVSTGMQTPPNIRQKVLPAGSLLIPDLILTDTGDYIVQIVDSTSGLIHSARGHLMVNEKKSPGGNESSLSGGAIAGIVIGVLAGVALIGGLTYFLFFRKSGG